MSTKIVAVLGAGGQLGRAVTKALLRHGYAVRAILRDPSKAHPDLAGATVMKGDASDLGSLQDTFKGASYVIVTTSAGDYNSDTAIETYVSGYVNAINATKSAGISRFLGIGGAGLLDLPGSDGKQLHDSEGFPAYLLKISAAHGRNLEALAHSGLVYTFFCPPQMQFSDGKSLGTVKTVKDVMTGAWLIHFEDIADEMVKSLESSEFANSKVGIGYDN